MSRPSGPSIEQGLDGGSGRCVDVCPVDCIYEGPDQLFIHPDECIDCGACEPECPVTAIFPENEVPAEHFASIARNSDAFTSDMRPTRPSRS